MKRRDFLTMCGLSAAGFLSARAGLAKTDPKAKGSSLKGSKPNIILVFTDDMGWGELGCSGNKIIKTPNIDKFHAESVRFTNYHVSTSCSPSRAQLMSGRHEFYGGVTHTTYGRGILNKDFTILPQYLKKAGYSTAIFGKWHLGSQEGYRPHDRGFDEAVYHHKGYMNSANYFDPALYHNGEREKYKGYCTDLFFSKAMEWIEENKDKPFFCYLSTNAPHIPLVVEEKYKAMYKDSGLNEKRQIYYGMVTNIDDNFGILRKRIDEMGIADNTILIFMTDNGHAISSSTGAGHDGNGFLKPDGLYNAGMRGAKGQPWIGGACVPFIIRWPGVMDMPRDDKTLCGALDLLPTFSELAGVSVDDPGVEGRSLTPLFKNKPEEFDSDRYLIVHKGRWPDGEVDAHKYIHAGVRGPRFSLVWDRKSNLELFDYINDPGETKNVIDQFPEDVKKMTAFFDQWWEKVRPCMINDARNERLMKEKSGNK
ncbi:arylsulfatase [Verrucomicrobiota bacterium]